MIEFAGMEFQVNRKLRKLIRHPKKFFADMRVIGQPSQRPIQRDREHEEVKASSASQSHASEGASIIEAPDWESFDLRGDDWLDSTSNKPIAVLWGFSPWKRDFVTRYLPEYRVAYARGRAGWIRHIKRLDQHDDLTFVIWGMSETPEVREYAAQRGIPLYRMEDGFIRSVALGSQHSMALSLVLDKEGIYFDASHPSDLERLLNEHDFEQEPKLMHAARSLLRLMSGLRVSKYNLGSLQSPVNLLGPRFKRRVLVIGQVEDDASVRYGMAEGWTNDRLIELARAENPAAEIIYKPHPDVVKGFRANSATLEQLRKICLVLTDDLVLADLFQEVDHVYTITSLSGIEALFHGLPVTVVGAPFYAGWGLTDDRTPITRRRRRLSLEELFCGAYLLYPRYLTDLEDPIRGCMAAMLRVVSERKLSIYKMISAKTIGKRAAWIAASPLWPVFLKPEYLPAVTQKYGKKLSTLLPIQTIFARCDGEYYQRSMGYLLVGKLRGSAAFGRVLDLLRACMRPQHFSELLVDLWRAEPSPAILSHWAWLVETSGDVDRARQALTYVASNGSYAKGSNEGQLFPIKKSAPVLALAQFELRQRNFDEAYRLFNQILLSGHMQGEVIAGIAEIARLRFDFSSAAELLKVFNHYDWAWKAGRGHLLEAQACSLMGNAVAAVESMALACKLAPQYVEWIDRIEGTLNRAIGELPYGDAMLAAHELDCSGGVIALAKALIACEKAPDAERVLLEYSPGVAEIPQYCLTLSLAYSYQGKLEDAKALVTNQLPCYPSTLLYREGLRLAVLKNDYPWGKSLLKEAEVRNIGVGDMYHRKIALGSGDIQGGYRSFRDMRITGTLKAYLGSRYVQSLDEVAKTAKSTTVILAFFGPGDEIRFASLYREMHARCRPGRVVFTCDPRLLRLLQRHYTDLEFAPVARIRNLAWLSDHKHYDKLPGSDLHTFFDNSGWELVQSADTSILTTDALGDLIEGYDSFKGSPYLKADPAQMAHWQTRLPGHTAKLTVGLSWRSSLTTYARNEHYFSVEELTPLFDVEDVQFVNLQYDECDEEIAWLEERFPGRVIHFKDLDQHNDLDGVAALMSCLDLIIAPATTVVELAGALGRPTWLLSNSSELHWRKIPGTETDVWHSSILHIEGETLRDKTSVMLAVRDALASYGHRCRSRSLAV